MDSDGKPRDAGECDPSLDTIEYGRELCDDPTVNGERNPATVITVPTEGKWTRTFLSDEPSNTCSPYSHGISWKKTFRCESGQMQFKVLTNRSHTQLP